MRKNKIQHVRCWMVGALSLVAVGTQAQELGQMEQKMNFDTYLNRVGKQNLEFLASRLNVNIADAERQ